MSNLTGLQESGRFLTSGEAVGTANRVAFHVSEPLSTEPGLFRTFAQLQYSESEIVEFANRYGALGAHVPILIGKEPSEEPRPIHAGEPFQLWTRSVSKMKAAVSLWDAVESNDAAFLRQRVLISDKPKGIRYGYEGPTVGKRKSPDNIRFEWIATQYEPERLASFNSDRAAAARFLVQRWINQNLNEHNVTARLLTDRRKALHLHFVPANLLGCLWLQFAQAIDLRRVFHRCSECNHWFQGRSDKVFCSPTCKASAHKMKIVQARQLSAEGQSVKAIASALNTHINTVKGWIK